MIVVTDDGAPWAPRDEETDLLCSCQVCRSDASSEDGADDRMEDGQE